MVATDLTMKKLWNGFSPRMGRCFVRSLSSRPLNGLVNPDLGYVKQELNHDDNIRQGNDKVSLEKARNMIRGQILDHSIDLRRVRPGDKVDIPYQITVSETMVRNYTSSTKN